MGESTDSVLRELAVDHIRDRVDAVLTPDELRTIGHKVVRETLGLFTLETAARWLKWKSTVALRRALKRDGFEPVKFNANQALYSFEQLVEFREKHRAHAARPKIKILRKGVA